MEIAFENGQISNFQGFVTLTLDRVILHTVMHHSSCRPLPTYQLDCIEIELTFYGRTEGRTFETHFIRSTRRSRPNNDSCRLNDILLPICTCYSAATQGISLHHHHLLLRQRRRPTCTCRVSLEHRAWEPVCVWRRSFYIHTPPAEKVGGVVKLSERPQRALLQLTRIQSYR